MTRLRVTHTFVVLDLTLPAYQEIRERLVQAGYGHVFIQENDRELIDMHGIAVAPIMCSAVHAVCPDGKEKDHPHDPKTCRQCRPKENKT